MAGAKVKGKTGEIQGRGRDGCGRAGRVRMKKEKGQEELKNVSEASEQ